MNAAVLALGVGVGIFVMFLGFARNAARSASTADIVAQRLQVYGGEKPLTMDEIELQKPFSERALRPPSQRARARKRRSRGVSRRSRPRSTRRPRITIVRSSRSVWPSSPAVWR